jgi:hypothetical protein
MSRIPIFPETGPRERRVSVKSPPGPFSPGRRLPLPVEGAPANSESGYGGRQSGTVPETHATPETTPFPHSSRGNSSFSGPSSDQQRYSNEFARYLQYGKAFFFFFFKNISIRVSPEVQNPLSGPLTEGESTRSSHPRGAFLPRKETLQKNPGAHRSPAKRFFRDDDRYPPTRGRRPFGSPGPPGKKKERSPRRVPRKVIGARETPVSPRFASSRGRRALAPADGSAGGHTHDGKSFSRSKPFFH